MSHNILQALFTIFFIKALENGRFVLTNLMQTLKGLSWENSKVSSPAAQVYLQILPNSLSSLYKCIMFVSKSRVIFYFLNINKTLSRTFHFEPLQYIYNNYMYQSHTPKRAVILQTNQLK